MFSPGVCFTTGCSGEGVCTDANSLCSSVSFAGQVCGCDGQLYAKVCDAYTRGVMLGAAEACPALEGRFRCGFEYCDPATAYCRYHVTGDSAGFRECSPLPVGCAASPPDCACVPDLGALSCLACRSVAGLTPYLELDCQGVVANP
jgi:hypothetical protein